MAKRRKAMKKVTLKVPKLKRKKSVKKKVVRKLAKQAPKLKKKKTVKRKAEREIITSQKLTPKEAIHVFAENEKLAGVYCNVAMVTHTEREFVLDFFFDIINQRSLVSRVITSPQHMKRVYEVLEDNIETYENKFGKIK